MGPTLRLWSYTWWCAADTTASQPPLSFSAYPVAAAGEQLHGVRMTGWNVSACASQGAKHGCSGAASPPFCRSCSLQEKGRAAAGSARDISHPRCASTVELTPSPMTNTHPCLSGASENKQLHLLDVNIITCNLLLNGTGLLFNYLINVFVQLYIWCKTYVTEYTWKCISRIQYSLTLALTFNIS